MVFAKINTEELDKAPVIEFGGPIVGTKSGPLKLVSLINVPEAWIGIEDFIPGTKHSWAYHYNEVQLVLEGKAEIIYTLAANPNRIFKATVAKGDTYIIPTGARVTFHVISKEPFRHYWVIMPRFPYEKWQRDAVKEERQQ
jgi:mannose-6-phosphate isomerase-like protein (cupin superfamily)